MNLNEVINEELASNLQKGRVLGIDIGSRTGKAVLIDKDKFYTALTPTGIDMQETAEELLEELLEQSGLQIEDIDYIVGTGYGRVAMNFENIPTQVVTEISCHAMGAHYLNPQVRTIIDIGGQDSKAIMVDRDTGKVSSFAMNDKCAAGTGRFLERVATLLDLTIDELGEEATKAESPTHISSQCVVFAESEAISLRAKGESRENIAAGIHLATARRVRNLLKRVGFEPDLVFSGGVSNNIGMKKALEELLGASIADVKLNTIYAGALGAAIHAHDFLREGSKEDVEQSIDLNLDLSGLEKRIQERENFLINSPQLTKIGYLCTYTPLELMNAAEVPHVRLFRAGNPDVVASGEQITQSVFCDFTKSVLGAFKENDPLYSSLNKIYTFYTCDCMKKVGEAINQFFTPSEVYVLPRLKDEDPSRNYYYKEILSFKKELEAISGKTINDEDLRRQIVIYNQLRSKLKDISELRKRENPPLTGKDFLDLVKGYYYLPPEDLLNFYQEVYDRLSAVPAQGRRKIRLMMSGGVVADGDRRLLELIEDEIGARVVVEDHCTGLKTVYHTLEEDGDPFRSLAYGYLDQAPCARMKPLEDRVLFSGKLAREYDVDGVLYVYLKFCPCYGQTKHEFFKYFREIGIPTLEIPIDYSRSDQGQLKTRLEAFIEVLCERGANL
ncbi:MAG: acyl-CoA dehydratase activase [Syntrophomonadaceae bacterium]|jgi:predicted CoA-substrate-specific enzyme activase|nr:acyl-CoA dehydratase activase [Syntrophomonadaceae bacterium]